MQAWQLFHKLFCQSPNFFSLHPTKDNKIFSNFFFTQIVLLDTQNAVLTNHPKNFGSKSEQNSKVLRFSTKAMKKFFWTRRNEFWENQILSNSVLMCYERASSDPSVVSEKKGTFICELIRERYIYLRNTQKQLKITNYVRNKSFLEFYVLYNGVCLKLLGSLL